MKLDKITSLFFAVRIDTRLREALAASKLSAKQYFDGRSDDYLRIMTIDDGERWLGKIVPPGPTIAELEDVQANLLSIMKRVAPDLYIAPAAVRIFCVHGVEGRLFVGDEPETIEDDQLVTR